MTTRKSKCISVKNTIKESSIFTVPSTPLFSVASAFASYIIWRNVSLLIFMKLRRCANCKKEIF